MAARSLSLALAVALAGRSLALPQPGEAARRALQTHAATAYPVTTNGAAVDSEITTAGEHQWFSFHGQAGFSYEIETVLGSAADTIVDLVDTDRSSVLVENDDDARDTNSYASYIEWTCPADGTYYVYVKGYGRDTGTFQFSVTAGAGGMGGVAGGDPCNGGVMMMQPNAEISFMPDGNYGDNAACSWMIMCPNGSPPTITLEDLDTEAGYDFMNIHEVQPGDGPCEVDASGMCTQGATLIAASGGLGAHVQPCAGTACNGNRYPNRITGATPNVMIQFNSDDSVTAGGFDASYTCGRPAPPPPRVPPPPPPPAVTPTGMVVTPLQMGPTVRGVIVTAGDHIWYSFPANSGDSFQFEVDISAQNGYTLSDSVLDIVDKDRTTVLAENDDDTRAIAHGSYASYQEWTAPDTGTYFVLVKAFSDETGTFGLTATQSGGTAPTGGGGGGFGGGNANGDPCSATGQALSQRSAAITYMPDGDYSDSLVCHWTITCPGGSGMVQAAMTGLNTEADYDFVNLYDGPSSSSRQIDGVSGDLINLATTHYSSSGPSMTVEFASDASIGAGGFSLDYSCAQPPPPPPRPPPTPPLLPPVAPPPPAHVVDTGHADDFVLATDGTATTGQVQQQGDQEWYQFSASRGVTYGFETQLTTIDDTMMDLVDTDRTSIITENDDDERNGGGFQSYIEWTCPADGTYFIMVKGYGSSVGGFTLTATSSGAGGGMSDPCAPAGSTMTERAASISFMPDGGTTDDTDCKWMITCPAGTMPTVSFTDFETESNYDFVKVYDGPTPTSPLLDSMSGSLTDLLRQSTFGSTGASMTIEFTSDGSVGGRGFNAAYECAGPRAPPPPPPPYTPPPPPRGEADTTLHIIDTDGSMSNGEVTSGSDHEWYQFDAIAAHTYQIETTLRSMTDTVIDLVDTDRASVIVENDDDSRNTATSLASFIEWTCPTDGTYFVMVKGYGQNDVGTFQMSVTDADAAGGIADPCAPGGATMRGSGTISFQPNGNYQNSAVCDWHVSCPRGSPRVDFTQFATEADWDFVDVLDGATASSHSVAHLSGMMVDMRTTSFTGTGREMTVEFTSDESVTDGGFVADYSCR